ncbi:MAG: hypothetical protein JW818_06395 [Pirellulales bacterium]|nr:hypothetical protein [Pirellulales bacterium]
MPNDEPLLNLKQAASLLGYKERGMRKLIERSKKRLLGYPVNGPTIKFFQPRPGDDIKFRPEWIQEFIDACTRDPEKAPLVTLIAKPKRDRGKNLRPGSAMRAASNSGFSSSLLAI